MSQDESPTGDTTGPFNEPGAHSPPQDLDYELVRRIGQGGYGEVWLVRDRAGEYFACKVVYRESFDNDRPYQREYEGIQKFEPVSRASESQVKILHVGRHESPEYFYYIMELADDVHGADGGSESFVPRTLRSEIERRKILPVNECIEIGLSLTTALQNLHEHGLIHRDIKPANIIFVKGVPKLADIGLVTDRDISVSYVGTEGFIPPEGPKTAQADIYGLGKVLYEIATGKDRMEFPELPENISDLPDRDRLLELNTVIIKACEANPRKRYASANEFYDELSLLKTGRSVRRRRAAQRRFALALRAAASLAAIAALAVSGFYFWKAWNNRPAAAQAASAKLPMPDPVSIAQKETTLKETYQSQIVSGTTQTREQSALELLKRSATSGDSASEVASLHVAGLLAAEADNVSLVMQICDALDNRYDVNIFPMKIGLLTQAGKSSRTPASKADLTDVCLATGFAALAVDDYPSAKKLAELSKNAARDSNRPTQAREADFLSDETDQCSDAYDGIATYRKILRDKPLDPEASLAVGKFICFMKNDWAAGLPLLARGNDQGVRSVANTEMTGDLNEPQDQLALGSAWWELSSAARGDDQASYQQRARYWYLKGIANSREPDRSRIREQLTERLKTVQTDAGQVHIVSRVGGTEFVDIYSDEVQWTGSRRGTTGNRINYVDLGDFKAGGLEMVKNNGATWLMPASVDFLSARLETGRTRGQATLSIYDDHVRVTLSHPRLGAPEITVTVIFGKQSGS